MRFPSRALAAATLVLGSATAALSPAAAGHARHDDDDRLPAAVTVGTSDYDFELILTPHEEEPLAPIAWVRRTDDVGSGGQDIPDRYGFVDASDWGIQSGRKCVALSGGVFDFDDAPAHALDYGITGLAVRTVVVVLEDGTRVSTRTSRTTVDGFRGWMLERPLGTAVAAEGYDRWGRLIASLEITHGLGAEHDFGMANTCVLTSP